MILALDISTSCTGYALFDENDLVDIGYINLSKHKGLFEKATYVKERIFRMSNDYNINQITVEENLQAFRPGLSSAKTLTKTSLQNNSSKAKTIPMLTQVPKP